MKQIILGLIVLTGMSSCMSVKQIGEVNMISNRNVDPKLDYNVISTYSGGSKNELRKSRAVTIEDAIDQTVRKIPGGEFLMNIKIYLINGKYLAVEGDVWGISTNLSYRGFKVGDKVVWKNMRDVKTGRIKSLKDDITCFIEAENGNVIEKKYDQISKTEISTGDDTYGGYGTSIDGTGVYDGTGDGVFGRKIIYRDLNASKAAINGSGKVVTKVCINRAGIVTYVELLGSETTLKDREGLKLYLKAARGYKYQPDPMAPKEQCGKLTFYIDNKINNKLRGG